MSNIYNNKPIFAAIVPPGTSVGHVRLIVGYDGINASTGEITYYDPAYNSFFTTTYNYFKSNMAFVLSLFLLIGFAVPLFAAADENNIDETARSYVDTIKDKIRGDYTYRCDIETDDQLEALDVNHGFRVYALTKDLVSGSDDFLNYSNQSDNNPNWKYVLTPYGEYGPGIQISIEEESEGKYQLVEYGGRAKPLLDAFNEAKNAAKALNMPLVENEMICGDWVTYFFRAADGKQDMLIPVVFFNDTYTVHPAITVVELRQHLLANIAEGERLREENGGEIPLGASFRFDLLTDDTTTATSSSETNDYLWLYIAGGAVIIGSVLTAVLILRKKHSANI